MIDAGSFSPRQKDLARRIFTALGEAEAKVHGTTVEEVHFHEVGAADSIADIVGTAVGWDLLGVDRLVASPVPTGSGRIRIAHGECSVPAPATAELLRGIPLAASADRRRIDHAHRRRDFGHAGRIVRPAAGDEDRADRLRGRAEGFCRAAEHFAAAGGRNGRKLRPPRWRSGLRAGNQSRRHQRRTGRLLHRAALGGRAHWTFSRRPFR